MALPSWRRMVPAGTILEAGNAAEYHTGTWRNQRPVVDMSRCTHCLFCWLFCPEGTIETADGRFVGIDLEYCKGCGICAMECPSKAIEMVSEVQSREGDA